MLSNVKQSEEPSSEVWREWRRLVNMNASELQRFLDSPEGKVAGLSRAEAKSKGIRSGRESAGWILKMLPHGKSYASAVRCWTPGMWGWARRQVAFIRRMRGVRGPLFDKEGNATRKHLALLVWGHDPQKPLREV